jgi:hypothetical protein
MSQTNMDAVRDVFEAWNSAAALEAVGLRA